MGIHINDINLTDIILISIYSTYSVLSLFSSPNILSVPLSRNSMVITKHRRIIFSGIWLIFCKLHISKTSFHSNMEWVPYQIKIIHLIAIPTPTVNQSCSQQSAWPLNLFLVQRLHQVCKMITLLFFSVLFFCKKLKHENQQSVIRNISDIHPNIIILSATYST